MWQAVRGNPCFIDPDGKSMLCITEILTPPLLYPFAWVVAAFAGAHLASKVNPWAGPGIAYAEAGDWQ